ncbi:hypothetical protein GCM10010232_05910 [Streptomyces amakusaensis]|uniref:Uncharacterized protein n=1 Tax=Streptomyces amakusaensis TaxID=67271 RepID=A0ABW0A9E6_9ACTN
MGLMSWLRGAGCTERETPGVRGEAAGPVAVRRPRLDLGALPPLQRSLGGQELISDPAAFRGSLTTRRDTALTTPLGHLVSADAPTGIVHGITAPVREVRPAQPAQPVRSVQLVGAPVQRSLGPAVSVRPGNGGDSPPPVSPLLVSPSLVSAGGSTAVAASESPVRRLVGERPVLPPDAPQVQTEIQPRPRAQPQVRAEAQRAAEPSRTPPAGRAPGLGAPLPALPPTAQRRTAATSAPGERPPVARTEAEPEAEPEAVQAAAAETEPETAAPTAPLLGDDPLLPAPQVPVPVPEPEPGPPVRLQASRSPVPAQARAVPLLGDRPLPLQLTETGRATAVPRTPGPQVPAPAAPVPVRWAPAGPGAAGTFVQRTAVPLSGTAPAPPPPPAPVQRRRSPAAAGPPVPRSVAAPSYAVPPLSAGEVAVAAGVAQRMADGSVVFGAPPEPAVRPPVLVQRGTETAGPPPPDPPPAPDPEPEPEPEPGPGPGPGPEPEQGAGAGPGASKAASPQVTDELVRALYAPLSRLFKAELRLERERAGFLINTRH